MISSFILINAEFTNTPNLLASNKNLKTNNCYNIVKRKLNHFKTSSLCYFCKFFRNNFLKTRIYSFNNSKLSAMKKYFKIMFQKENHQIKSQTKL